MVIDCSSITIYFFFGGRMSLFHSDISKQRYKIATHTCHVSLEPVSILDISDLSPCHKIDDLFCIRVFFFSSLFLPIPIVSLLHLPFSFSFFSLSSSSLSSAMSFYKYNIS